MARHPRRRNKPPVTIGGFGEGELPSLTQLEQFSQQSLKKNGGSRLVRLSRSTLFDGGLNRLFEGVPSSDSHVLWSGRERELSETVELGEAVCQGAIAERYPSGERRRRPA